MEIDRAIIFHMCIPCGKIFIFGTKVRVIVKVKVKYQGHNLKKKWPLLGALVFHKRSLLVLGVHLASPLSNFKCNLTLKVSFIKKVAFAASVDQAAQNVQPDLRSTLDAIP